MVTPRNEYYISYSVYFDPNFDWGGSNEGGKLPGLAGGGLCSGCQTCTGSNGFTARLMWRTGGQVVLYLYHLNKVNPPCGDNIPLKDASGQNLYFQKGRWYTVTERVKVNSGSNKDGEVELWVDGVPALLKTGIAFVTNGDKVDNLYFSTFHGGGDATWAPSNDCYIWFDDIIIGQTAADVGLGNSNPEDTQAPTAPSNVTASVITDKGFTLNWAASTDNVGVTGYNIYINGTLYATSATNTATITDLASATQYTVTIRAKDAANNLSSESSPIQVTTLDNCGTPIPWTNTTVATQTGTFTAVVDITPTGSPMDGVFGFSNGNASAYSNLACIVQFATDGKIYVRNGSSYTALTSVTYIPQKTYHVRFVVNVATRQYDVYITPQGQSEIQLANKYAFRTEQAGVTQLNNRAVYTQSCKLLISNFSVGSGADTQPPTAPQNVVASQITHNSLLLQWTVSTDNVGVTGYDVYINNVLFTNSTTNTITLQNLLSATMYQIYVKAKDAAGNVSSASSNLEVQTLFQQTISLKKGWNLISTNLQLQDSTIETIFAGLDVLMVKDANGFWKKGQNTALNSLKTITPGKGYLVNMNNAGTLTITGTPYTGVVQYAPTDGWQLIGSPFQNTTPFDTYFNASNCQTIKNFDGFWQPEGTMNSIQNFEPGKGYFLKK